MTEIDFLPAEYWNHRASQRDRWYILGIGVASLLLLLGDLLNQSRRVEHLRAQLSSLEAQQRDGLEHAAEIQRLEARRSSLASDAKVHSLLRAHPSMSRVMVAMATSCPPHLTVSTIRVQPTRRASTEPKSTGATAKPPSPASSAKEDELVTAQLERFFADVQQARLSLEITGIAESDLDVTEFIDHLERSDCFAEVTLTNTDAQPAGQSPAREFKIQCELAKAW